MDVDEILGLGGTLHTKSFTANMARTKRVQHVETPNWMWQLLEEQVCVFLTMYETRLTPRTL
jgi:hypothetical protein